MAGGGVKVTLDKLIAENKVVIISKSGCPICLGARNTIRKHFGRRLRQEEVAFVDIGQDFEVRSVLNYLRFLTGGCDVPKIFINGRYVGGRDELAQLHKSGQLEEMLHGETDTMS